MLFLEALIKFGAVGMLIAMAVLVLRDGRSSRIFQFSLLLILSMISILMTTGSENISLSAPWSTPLRLVDCLNPVFIWWLGLAMFEDDFKLGLREWSISLLVGGLAFFNRLHYLGFDLPWSTSLNFQVSSLSFMLMLHLCFKAIVGHKEDLVERRRRVRIWFVVSVAVVMIAAIVAERAAELLGIYQQHTIWVTHFFTFVLVLWSVIWLTRLHPETLAFATDSTEVIGGSSLSSADNLAYERLLSVMNEQKLYSSHGLAIGDLAEKVGMPAHQLRKLINQTMGYRNFSSFLNKYRLADVKQSLSDPLKARTPILTLAMEAGFSSLAPFNRAFKASEGITPTNFRSQKLSQIGEKTA